MKTKRPKTRKGQKTIQTRKSQNQATTRVAPLFMNYAQPHKHTTAIEKQRKKLTTNKDKILATKHNKNPIPLDADDQSHHRPTKTTQ